ncbi:ABC transporter permease [Rhodococcus sp. NPDC047139]|uniref:ABC transporter permease n=1 Tax=Rhodococcus sp. NPDC047139 TaxID=3155141 RepID=UPI003405575B
MGTVVVLITLLVGLLSGLTAGLAHQNISAITTLPADRIAFDAPAPGKDLSYADSIVTERQLQQLSAIDGVTSAEPLGISSARLVTDGAQLTVAAFGVRSGSPLVPGDEAVDDRAVVLSPAAAGDLDLSPGDRVDLGGHELTVAAVDGDVSFAHMPVAWVDLSVWNEIASAGAGGSAATVAALRTTADFDETAADRLAGTKTVARDESVSAIGSYSSENGSLQLMRGFLFVISALVIGAFFTVWTIQRSGDIAVLQALGATPARLVRDALGQALVVLTGGTALGTLLAASVGAAVSGAVPFVLTPATILTPAAVMIVLGSLGAALAVRRITSVDPLTALGSAR